MAKLSPPISDPGKDPLNRETQRILDAAGRLRNVTNPLGQKTLYTPYCARYYHPRLQRFIAEDPLEFDGGDVNLYGYVLENPVSFVDPLGLWSASISAFAGPGASFTFGQNPNGSGFVSLQFGYGIGGGMKIDPFGQQPGYSPSQGTAWGLGLGLYAQADFNAGYVYAGASANVGRIYRACGSDPYFTPPNWRAGGRMSIFGINATGSAGGQITVFGGGKLKR